MINWDKLVPLKDAAKRCGLPYPSVLRWAQNGKLPGAIQRMGTRWFLPPETVELMAEGSLNVRQEPEDDDSDA